MNSVLCLVAVIALFSAVTAHPSQCIGECPKVNPNDDVFLLPHQNCSQYCSCVYGRPVELPCPPGLHFSPEDRVCVFKGQSKCVDQLPTAVRALEAFDSLCFGVCPSNHAEELTITLEHQDCGKYCKCVKGNAYARECPAGFHFSSVLGVCTFPEEAQCSRITTTPAPSFPPNGWCPCPVPTAGPTSTTSHPTASSSWPTPSSTASIPTAEPTSTTSHPTASSSWPTPSSTASIPTAEPTTTTSQPTASSSWPTPSSTASIPTAEPTSTTSQPTASSSWPTPSSTASIPTAKPTKPTPIPTLTPLTKPPSGWPQGCIGKCPAKDPVYAVHLPNERCSKFCKCSRGMAYLMSCPANLYYNPVKQVCDQPRASGCTGIRD